jgi:heme A synthase
MKRREHGRRFREVRVLAVLLAGLIGFYVLPVDTDDSAFIPRGIVCAAMVGGLVWLFSRQIRAQVRALGDSGVRLESLFYLLALTVFTFALAYYFLAGARAGEFVGLATRTDALYFTVTTMVTVGFGDVHAQGQVARALVTAHMVFDVVFVSAFVSVLSARVRRTAERERKRAGTERV